jgi:sugar phosphate permease
VVNAATVPLVTPKSKLETFMQSDKAGSLTASPEDPSSLNRRIFWKLMPLLILVYTVSFLDRTNIALAKHSMSIDLGLSAASYGLGAGLFFLSYASLEIPSNLLMHRVGARFWITRIMVTWGVLSTAMAFVQGETSFYVLRLLLGAAEAGFFPGVILYLTYWFDRKDCARDRLFPVGRVHCKCHRGPHRRCSA